MKKVLVVIGLSLLFTVLSACVGDPIAPPRQSATGEAALKEIATLNAVAIDLQAQINFFSKIATEEAYTRTPAPTVTPTLTPPNIPALIKHINAQINDELEGEFGIGREVENIIFEPDPPQPSYNLISIEITCHTEDRDSYLSKQIAVDIIRTFQLNGNKIANMFPQTEMLSLTILSENPNDEPITYRVPWRDVKTFISDKNTLTAEQFEQFREKIEIIIGQHLHLRKPLNQLTHHLLRQLPPPPLSQNPFTVK